MVLTQKKVIVKMNLVLECGKDLTWLQPCMTLNFNVWCFSVLKIKCSHLLCFRSYEGLAGKNSMNIKEENSL